MNCEFHSLKLLLNCSSSAKRNGV